MESESLGAASPGLSMANFYLNCKTASEVVKWYLYQTGPLANGDSITPSGAGQAPVDILQLVGSLSFAGARAIAQLSGQVKRSRYSNLVLLVSTGGAILYLLRKRRRRPQRDGRHFRRTRFNRRTFWEWLWNDHHDMVESFDDSSGVMVARYFGPSSSMYQPPICGRRSRSRLSSCDRLIIKGDKPEFDVSLNSFGSSATPRKFLKRPLYDIRDKSFLGCYDANSDVHAAYHRAAELPLVNVVTNPCPRCVKGTCRLRKHQHYHQQQQLQMHQNRLHQDSSSSGSSGTSPQFIRPPQLHPGMTTSTPEWEDSGSIEGSTVYARLRAGGHKPQSYHPSRDLRRDGDGSEEISDPVTSSSSEDCSPPNGVMMGDTPVAYSKSQYRPCHKLYGRSKKDLSYSHRGTPDGRERWSLSPVRHKERLMDSMGSEKSAVMCNTGIGCAGNLVPRENSVDSLDDCASIVSASESVGGFHTSDSMLDLIQNAREVRRLIREASFDSQASDLSLDFPSNGHCPPPHAAFEVDAITKQIDDLTMNCLSSVGQPEGQLPSPVNKKSCEEADLPDEGADPQTPPSSSSEENLPDMKVLHKSLKTNKGMWRLTDFSREDSSGLLSLRGTPVHHASSDGLSSLEWDSPVHGWHDSRPNKLALGRLDRGASVQSESGDEVMSFSGSGLDPWEWDNDCYYMNDDVYYQGEEGDDDERVWLPDAVAAAELDMDWELHRRGSLDAGGDGDSDSFSFSRSASCSRRRTSLSDSCRLPQRRLPPSGRSSVERAASSRGSSVSEDITLISDNFTAQKNRRTSAYSEHHSSGGRSKNRRFSTGSSSSSSSSFNAGCADDEFPAGHNRVFGSTRLPGPGSLCSEESGYQEGVIDSLESSFCSINSSSMIASSTSGQLSPVKEAREPPATPVKSICGTVTADTAHKSSHWEQFLQENGETVIKVTLKEAETVASSTHRNNNEKRIAKELFVDAVN